MVSRRLAVIASVLAGLLMLLAPGLVSAQEPIDQSTKFAEVRATFEAMEPADWEAAGYQVIPPGACIASPAGGMGIHAINPQLHEAQFQSGELDPENPPLLLLDASAKRVIGLEWEAAESVGEPPKLFGQPALLLPGHPGIEEPHYMLHAYFRPNGQVLFAEFDPKVSCELPPTSAALATDSAPDAAGTALLLMTVFAGAFALALRMLSTPRAKLLP